MFGLFVLVWLIVCLVYVTFCIHYEKMCILSSHF